MHLISSIRILDPVSSLRLLHANDTLVLRPRSDVASYSKVETDNMTSVACDVMLAPPTNDAVVANSVSPWRLQARHGLDTLDYSIVSPLTTRQSEIPFGTPRNFSALPDAGQITCQPPVIMLMRRLKLNLSRAMVSGGRLATLADALSDELIRAESSLASPLQITAVGPFRLHPPFTFYRETEWDDGQFDAQCDPKPAPFVTVDKTFERSSFRSPASMSVETHIETTHHIARLALASTAAVALLTKRVVIRGITSPSQMIWPTTYWLCIRT